MDRELRELLGEALRELSASGDVEGWLAHHPQRSEELRPYLEVAASLPPHGNAEPSEPGLLSGRARLLRQISEGALVDKRPMMLHLTLMRVAIAATALFVLGGTLGASAHFNGPDPTGDVLGALHVSGGGGAGWDHDWFKTDTDADGFSDKFEEWAGSDPNNAASTPELRFLGDACSDTLDNDLDGQVDDADQGCQGFDFDFDFDEDDDGDFKTDSDGDGFSDRFEQFAGADPNDAASTPELRFIDDVCSDTLDNDLDGQVDEADSGCRGFDFDFDFDFDDDDDHDFFKADADGDGFSDWFEQFAGADPNDAASTPELRFLDDVCADAVDNDLDGQVDGDDPGCQGFGFDFDDFDDFDSDDFDDFDDFKTDSDGDGFSDSFEQFAGSDPNNAASTPEVSKLDGVCSDASDNDLDGQVDSDDPGCQGFGFDGFDGFDHEFDSGVEDGSFEDRSWDGDSFNGEDWWGGDGSSGDSDSWSGFDSSPEGSFGGSDGSSSGFDGW